MALDQAYFDSISIELVKRKYYNANKVEAVFADIRQRALELGAELAEEKTRNLNMAREIATLRRELARHSENRDEITDAVCSAQSVYRAILEKANERADAILHEAEERERSLDARERRQREQAAQLVEACLSRVRTQQQAALDELSASWQTFLSGLYDDAEQPAPPAEQEPDGAPADLDEKIQAIARELFAIEDTG